ncbi:SDR family NAD(P)-dependent oxidoreductase [Actinoplanes sp. NPDC051633]|uniref:SDR family NAD(P)-dependent oxidoreductase n=1 Tax=Actinoplanes sp. NPDC051633 TaxID=3155670 RepID=UPI003448F82E
MTTTLVTGGGAGIGRAVAAELAGRGHRVLTVSRSSRSSLQADLSLMRETGRAAEEVAARTDRLDSIVLCAGVFAGAPEWTDEGLERVLALNYLSRYLLIRRLLPLVLAAPAGRIVLVANAGKYPDTLDLDDLQMRRGGRGIRVAGRTQFANDLLAVDLMEELRATPVEVACVFPGLVATAVLRDARGVPGPVRAVAAAAQRIFGARPEVAARPIADLADDPAATAGGGFVGPRLRRLEIPPRVRAEERRAAVRTATEALVNPWLPATPGPA